jgi:hypothetical protein
VIRYRSEEEYQAAVEAYARKIWDEREKLMPARARQTWEQGTDLAKRATIAMAKADITLLGKAAGSAKPPA